jgi:uncharacterized protein with HEPN domain
MRSVSRDVRLYIDDMITACEKIQRYLAGRPRPAFEQDEQAFDAVLKNLEVIGEASKRLSASFREAHPEVEWREIAGLRDIIVHQYFGLDLDIVWDVVASRVPDLLDRLRRLTDVR